MKDSWFDDLQSALNTFNWAEAECICKRFIEELDAAATPYPETPATKILQALRRKRQYSLMVLVADALIRGGQSASEILRQYAQAMIDQGNLTAPLALLKSIVDDAGSPPKEKGEAKGLLGRIYKQLYANANDASNPRHQKHLRQAIQYYFSIYQTDQNCLWHGINVVALLARAEHDHVSVPDLPPMRDIALEIDASLKQITTLQLWDRATAIEDAVALGNFHAAYEHALNYASDEKADAFEIASLLRQLTEVWQLRSDTEPGNILLPILRSALLKREGSVFNIDPKKIVREAKSIGKLEKVFGEDRYESIGWLKTALTRCTAVARVESVTEKRIGTGFLVRACDFFRNRHDSELLFLTNAHVISPTDRPFPGALPPQAAKVVFEANAKEYKVASLLWSSPPGDLDATFLTLASLQEREYCPLEPPPAPFDVARKARVYVIGYPLGGGLSISLQDSIWLDTDGRLLHYRTPTEPGSSGSPVFDQHYWSLIGLHHAGEKDMPQLRGGGTYEANEGVAISAIQLATRSCTAATAAGRSDRT